MGQPGVNIELMVVSQEEREIGSVPDWLAELCHMRGGVLYNRGGRRFFRLLDGSSSFPPPFQSREWTRTITRVVAILLCAIPACAQRRKIQFTLKDGAIRISATVNGHPTTLTLDTGATRSVFDNKLQIFPAEKEILLNAGVGAVKAEIAPAVFQIGDLHIESMATYLPKFTDQGVIGLDVMRQFAQVTIDFEKQEITFIPHGATNPNKTKLSTETANTEQLPGSTEPGSVRGYPRGP